MYIFDIPHFYIIWKILKNPIVGRPIVAGYNWIVTPWASFNFCWSLFKRILFQIRKHFDVHSLSLIRILEKSKFDKEWLFFITSILFKFVHQYFNKGRYGTHEKDIFRYQNMIPNALLILDL